MNACSHYLAKYISEILDQLIVVQQNFDYFRVS